MCSSIYRVQSSTRRLPIRALFGFTLKLVESYLSPSSQSLCVVVCPWCLPWVASQVMYSAALYHKFAWRLGSQGATLNEPGRYGLQAAMAHPCSSHLHCSLRTDQCQFVLLSINTHSMVPLHRSSHSAAMFAPLRCIISDEKYSGIPRIS